MMESVSFVGIDIKVIAWDEHSECAVAEDWLEVPPAVDEHNVEDYVLGRFGEPVDVAVARTDEFGELVMGWVFAQDTLDQVDLPSDGLEMMVVPFVRFPDGTRRELFEYRAELSQEFAALVALVDPHHAPLGDHAPVEAHDRLEHEQLTLCSTEVDQVELQLGGWLRRMVAEGWTYLVLEVSGTGRYVQFLTHDGSWLRGEVVGDRYLDEHTALSADEHQRLVDIGWNPPGDRGDESGNYWVDWGDDAPDDDLDGDAPAVPSCDLDEAARFGATALVQVFGPLRRSDVDISTGHASYADD
jgi:hypothetical protein